MTQTLRWFAAFALLLAVGVTAVRAEHEQEEAAPPVRKSVEVLPAPRAVQAAPCCKTCCPSCACNGKCCAPEYTILPTPNVVQTTTQYVVKTKLVDASPDGDCNEILSPNVTVFDGQTASFIVHGEQTPTEHRDIAMQFQVTKQGKGVKLTLGVVDQKEYLNAPAGAASMAAGATHSVLDVTLGKTKRIVFTKNQNGSDASWVELTVAEIAAPETDEDGSALDYVGAVVEDFIDAVSDVATTLFGDNDAEVKQASFPTPTPVAAAPRAFPDAAPAPCPMCKQCAAVEKVKKAAVRIRSDVKEDRMHVEMVDGDKHWEASARQVSLIHGRLVLDGDVQCNGSASPFVTAEKIEVQLPHEPEIQVGD